ncbi:non-ribosomal peptide synthetase [Ornithinibacillus scapharcae]|uniref:non-ribosomal peptide synthetase n=1 Tax=Ornithinibacillus scapharcae TaxID=1147159 RepID=UPI000225AB9F|nr:non-ribosomal peptide synthetase [Ornithinibacillus scapharcae]
MSKTVTYDKTQIEDAYPLTNLQEGMLFHSLYNHQSGVYHDLMSYHLKGKFDEGLFNQALQNMMKNHAVLRTSFDLVQFSQPLQIVHKSVIPNVEFIDVSHIPQEQQLDRIEQWLLQKKKESFDFNTPPLFRVYIHNRGEGSFQLSVLFHHAILDGWSASLFISELLKEYHSLYTTGQSTSKGQLEVSFRNFVEMEKQAIESSENRTYWKEKLKDYQGSSLPEFEILSPDEQNMVGSKISEKLYKQLMDLSKNLRVPFKTILFAVHLKVMGFITGQTDVMTGLVTNGRPESKDGDRILGLFLNTLPVRYQVGNESWADFIKNIFNLEKELMRYRRFPLAEMKNMFDGSILFETAFNYTHFHHTNEEELKEGSLKIVDRYFNEVTNFPLMVHFRQSSSNRELYLTLQFDPERIPLSYVERAHQYFIKALKLMVQNENSPIQQNDLLTEEELDQINNWNNTEKKYDDCLVQQYLEEISARKPEQIAVTFNGESMTYRELNQKANQVAHYLRKQGIGPDKLVGICMNRSIEMVIAIWGILKSGSGYVPIAPEDPKERTQFVIQEAELQTVLTEQSTKGTLVDITNINEICLTDWALHSESIENPQVTVKGENVAYVIYTSGSTGKPKGVEVLHQGLTNRLEWMQDYFSLSDKDVVLQKTPYTFDVSVWEFLWPLMVGARLVIAKPDGHKDPQYLGKLMEDEKVTTMHFVPSMLRAFLDFNHTHTHKHLKRVICSGEELTKEIQDKFYKHYRDKSLFNLYGPTEASIDVTYYECEKDSPYSKIPIGKPIANTKIYILDHHLNPVPIGVPGELYIGGVGLAKGYLKRKEQTLASFITHPNTQERLYKSGDLARYRLDGNIEYLGRIDHQVKLRGNRIELGEIESVLRQIEDVKDSVVHVFTHSDGEQALVAYLVASNELDFSVIRSELKDKIPSYMLPSHYMTIKEIPRTSSGKVNRKGLPKLETNRSSLSTKLIPARDDIEKKLVEMWQEGLNVNPIGITDDFFELGGQSLLALRVMMKINNEFDKELPLSVFFERGRTIEGMATLLRSKEDVHSPTIIPLNNVTGDLNMFMVHPHGGHVFSYERLAHYLEKHKIGLYGVRAKGLQIGEEPFQDIQEMAKFYISKMKEVKPMGPYHIGGWCMGGLISFEMARQLLRDGEEVFVSIISSSIVQGIRQDLVEDDLALMNYAISQGRIELSRDELRDLSPEDQLKAMLEVGVEQNVIRNDISNLEQAKTLYKLYKYHRTAVLNYQAQQIDNNLSIYKALENHLADSAQGDLGWGQVTKKNVYVTEIPGTHYTMLAEPNARVVAEKLAEKLSRTTEFSNSR